MGELLQLSRTEQFKLSNNSESGYHHGRRVFMKIVNKKKDSTIRDQTKQEGPHKLITEKRQVTQYN